MFLRRTAVGAALIAAPLAFAAPAMADSGGMNFGCSPCVNTSTATTGAPWTDAFANAPWERFFDGTNGVIGDEKGAWEQAFSGDPGASIPGSGSWEKAFPPAP